MSDYNRKQVREEIFKALQQAGFCNMTWSEVKREVVFAWREVKKQDHEDAVENTKEWLT